MTTTTTTQRQRPRSDDNDNNNDDDIDHIDEHDEKDGPSNLTPSATPLFIF
jgi:hypothetical protein